MLREEKGENGPGKVSYASGLDLRWIFNKHLSHSRVLLNVCLKNILRNFMSFFFFSFEDTKFCVVCLSRSTFWVAQRDIAFFFQQLFIYLSYPLIIFINCYVLR